MNCRLARLTFSEAAWRQRHPAPGHAAATPADRRGRLGTPPSTSAPNAISATSAAALGGLRDLLPPHRTRRAVPALRRPVAIKDLITVT